MNSTESFLKLLHYTRWANLRVIEALRATPSAHADALPLFAHVLAAEHTWLSRLRKQEPRVVVWPQLSLEECQAWVEENTAAFEALLGATGLTEVMRYRTTTGQPYSNTVEEILTHVFTHGGYHRGQVARVIGRAGGKAPNTDYIMFLRETQPAAPQ